MISILVVPGEPEILPTAVPVFCNPPSPPNLKLDLTTVILKVGLHQVEGCLSA